MPTITCTDHFRQHGIYKVRSIHLNSMQFAMTLYNKSLIIVSASADTIARMWSCSRRIAICSSYSDLTFLQKNILKQDSSYSSEQVRCVGYHVNILIHNLLRKCGRQLFDCYKCHSCHANIVIACSVLLTRIATTAQFCLKTCFCFKNDNMKLLFFAEDGAQTTTQPIDGNCIAKTDIWPVRDISLQDMMLLPTSC